MNSGPRFSSDEITAVMRDDGTSATRKKLTEKPA
jgi:hypothetical protein